jgi:hypothetical protein
MNRKIRKVTIAAMAGALALGAFGFSPAQAASPAQPQAKAVTTDLSARSRHHYRHYRHYRHHYRHHGNNRAALRVFGAFAGAIAGLAARDNCGYGRCYYGPRYGYAPRYYYRY